MDEYFVRVYYMKSGEKIEIRAVYETYSDAYQELNTFNPNSDLGKTPEEDMAEVSYVQIEKRYSPIKLWERATPVGTTSDRINCSAPNTSSIPRPY